MHYFLPVKEEKIFDFYHFPSGARYLLSLRGILLANETATLENRYLHCPEVYITTIYMGTVGLVIRSPDPEILGLAEKVVEWSEKHCYPLLWEKESAEKAEYTGESVEVAELLKKVDVVVSLGGDGTLLGVARCVRGKSPTMVGVNFGKLGFLTEIAPEELIDCLDSISKGQAQYGTRTMLEARVVRGEKEIFEGQSLNDVVVQKGAREKLLDLVVHINDEEIMSIRADGLIFSTPTGSTAYSLAAGGSIVHPELSTVLVTPICPHSLTVRPLILPLHSVLSVELPSCEGEVFVTLDGQDTLALEKGDRIVLMEASQTVEFVRSPSQTYFDVLREKLNWGRANKA